MGKRKKAAKKPGAPKKGGGKLPTTFQCLFCNHENSVIVSIDKKSGVGNLNCKVCGQSFQTPVNLLSAAVDVYADWHDACDAVAKQQAEDEGEMYRPGRPMKTAVQRDEEDGMDGHDDFIVDDDQDAEGEYDE